MDRVDARVRIAALAVPLSVEMHKYLMADGMWLPRDAYPPPAPESLHSEEEEEEEEEEGDHAVPSDATLEAAVSEALQRWGSVTVKCDDVAPSDASWMMPFGDARCRTRGHVYMALKASDRVQAHLATRAPGSATLCIQQWVVAPPAGEWRCYARVDGVVAFAAQRLPINAIDVDLVAVGARLAAFWERYALRGPVADVANGSVVEIDVWLVDDGTAGYVLGMRSVSRTQAEESGVFTWDELTGPVAPGVVVARALTGKAAMAVTGPIGVPADMTGGSNGSVEGAFEQLQRMDPRMLDL